MGTSIPENFGDNLSETWILTWGICITKGEDLKAMLNYPPGNHYDKIVCTWKSLVPRPSWILPCLRFSHIWGEKVSIFSNRVSYELNRFKPKSWDMIYETYQTLRIAKVAQNHWLDLLRTMKFTFFDTIFTFFWPFSFKHISTNMKY